LLITINSFLAKLMSWGWLLFLTNKICSQDLNYTIGQVSKLLMTASQEKDGSLLGLAPFLSMISKYFYRRL